MKMEVATRSTAEQATAIIGSRNWMAPERLMGRLLRPSADIYAFGMTIYEVCVCARYLHPVVDIVLGLYVSNTAR
jgi:serine/threonine protein kinase